MLTHVTGPGTTLPLERPRGANSRTTDSRPSNSRTTYSSTPPEPAAERRWICRRSKRPQLRQSQVQRQQVEALQLLSPPLLPSVTALDGDKAEPMTMFGRPTAHALAFLGVIGAVAVVCVCACIRMRRHAPPLARGGTRSSSRPVFTHKVESATFTRPHTAGPRHGVGTLTTAHV